MNNDKSDERMTATITKEEISAMVDGEVSEFALRRILKESESNPMYALQWEKYQVISSALKGEIEPLPFTDISSKVMQAIQKETQTPLPAQNSATQKGSAQKSTQTGEVLPFKSEKNEKESTKKPRTSSNLGISQRQIGFGLAASFTIAFFSWQYMATQKTPSFARIENPTMHQTINGTPVTHSDTQPLTQSPADKTALTGKTKKTTGNQDAYQYASTSNVGIPPNTTALNDHEPGAKMERINGKEVLWIDDFDLASDSEIARSSNNYWMLHHGSQGFKASSTGAMPYSRMINWQMSHTNPGTYSQPVTPQPSNQTPSSSVIVR